LWFCRKKQADIPASLKRAVTTREPLTSSYPFDRAALSRTEIDEKRGSGSRQCPKYERLLAFSPNIRGGLSLLLRNLGDF
jgi:hypothetical protein